MQHQPGDRVVHPRAVGIEHTRRLGAQRLEEVGALVTGAVQGVRQSAPAATTRRASTAPARRLAMPGSVSSPRAPWRRRGRGACPPSMSPCASASSARTVPVMKAPPKPVALNAEPFDLGDQALGLVEPALRRWALPGQQRARLDPVVAGLQLVEDGNRQAGRGFGRLGALAELGVQSPRRRLCIIALIHGPSSSSTSASSGLHLLEGARSGSPSFSRWWAVISRADAAACRSWPWAGSISRSRCSCPRGVLRVHGGQDRTSSGTRASGRPPAVLLQDGQAVGGGGDLPP